MKKALFYLILMLPCFAAAQSDNPISEDIYSDTKGISSVIHLDNDINVIQVLNDNNSFDLMAVNGNMKVLWHTTIQGQGVGAGTYKNKIAVIAATEHSGLKGNNNTYKAFMIDPVTGKTITEKVIYEDDNDYVEIPYVLIGNNYFKFGIRKTNVSRKLHVGIPILVIFQMQSWTKETNETQKFQVFDFNEQLETINTTNPVVNGTLINITCNKNGDMFVSWLNSSDIEVYKYQAGKTAPSAQLTADVAIKPTDDTNLSQLILFSTSDTKPDDLYYTLLYRNEDKDPELMVGKMDFISNSKNAITEVFKKNDLKDLEKKFTPLDKKIDEADLGPPRGLGIKNLSMTENGPIVVLQSDYVGLNGRTTKSGGLSLNAFTPNLQLKFQQIFPTDEIFDNSRLTGTIHYAKNKLYMIGNSEKYIIIYASMDLNTGQWLEMYSLIKKKNKGYPDESNILWYNGTYIIPYISSHGYYHNKYSFGLQLNQY